MGFGCRAQAGGGGGGAGRGGDRRGGNGWGGGGVASEIFIGKHPHTSQDQYHVMETVCEVEVGWGWAGMGCVGSIHKHANKSKLMRLSFP